MNNKTTRILGLVIIVLALLVMESGPARAQSPATNNFNAASKTAGAAAGMMGTAAVACVALNFGCPVGIAVGGAILGGIGLTIGMFPTPPDNSWRRITPEQAFGSDGSGGALGWGGGFSGGDEECGGDLWSSVNCE